MVSLASQAPIEQAPRPDLTNGSAERHLMLLSGGLGAEVVSTEIVVERVSEPAEQASLTSPRLPHIPLHLQPRRSVEGVTGWG